MNYWLMKTEPDVFSIDSLRKAVNKTSSWEGVRNYQARNFMRDEMKKGDKVLIYHSSCPQIGIAGIAQVAKESHPDLSALNIKGEYFDPKSTTDNPRWFMVDVKWVKTFKSVIPLAKLREIPELKDMIVLKKGNRLSITPVTKEEFLTIIDL